MLEFRATIHFIHSPKEHIKKILVRKLWLVAWSQTCRHTPEWLQMEALSWLSEFVPFSPSSKEQKERSKDTHFYMYSKFISKYTVFFSLELARTWLCLLPYSSFTFIESVKSPQSLLCEKMHLPPHAHATCCIECPRYIPLKMHSEHHTPSSVCRQTWICISLLFGASQNMSGHGPNIAGHATIFYTTPLIKAFSIGDFKTVSLSSDFSGWISTYMAPHLPQVPCICLRELPPCPCTARNRKNKHNAELRRTAPGAKVSCRKFSCIYATPSP